MTAGALDDLAVRGCAALSRDAGEPLAGTAPAMRRMVAVEHVGMWPPRVAAHPDESVAELAGRLRAEGVVLLLIRRPGRRGRETDDERAVFVADLAPGRSRVVRTTVRGPGDLDRVSFDLSAASRSWTHCCWCAPTAAATSAARSADGPWPPRSPRPSRPAVCGSAPTWAGTVSPRPRWCSPPGTPTGAWTRPPPSTRARQPGWARSWCPTAADTSVWSRSRRSPRSPCASRPGSGTPPVSSSTRWTARGGVEVHDLEGRRWAVDVRADTGTGARPPSCGAALEPVTPLVAGPPTLLT